MIHFAKTSFISFLILLPCLIFSQKNAYFEGEVGAVVGSASQVPFWLSANRFGAVPASSPAMVATLRAFSGADSTRKVKKFFDFNYGFELFGTLNQKSEVAVIEGFVSARLGGFVLSGGKRREVFGLLDTLLSTGSVAWSGNALPVPKIQLATDGFLEIPFTKRLFAFQASYAHGWLGPTRINPNYFRNSTDQYGHYVPTYLHQKTFYGRFGKPTWRVNLYGGFSDFAFWGNESTIWNPGFDLTLAESYRRVVMGVNWNSSKVGNHFGSIDLATSVKGKNYDVLLYRQSIFDTGSLLNAFNLDGLMGVSIQNKKSRNGNLYLRKFVVEYFYSNDQVDPLVTAGGGNNDYFNHYIYLDGWAYQGRLLGTPLAVIDRDLAVNANRQDFRGGYIANNRIYALHLGAVGSIGKSTGFVFKTSMSRNLGTYAAEFSSARHQLSSFLSLTKRLKWLKGTEGSLSVAADLGNLRPASVACMVGIKKQGFIGF